ncbi:MAG: helix-turn-helix domain-containing protein [Firmicutes bacterium]|nr:helix-turn-helix domain-containing protein [Bacillota bacterium]
MSVYVTGNIIKQLRTKKNYTQKQLAEKLNISEKTISKWETNRGLPDITLIEPLANSLDISVAELLSGKTAFNQNKSGNTLRGKFYVCPVCGNIIYSLGEGSFSCCGILLPPLEAEEFDDEHNINIEKIETEYYISITHTMTKEHYISFIAYVTNEKVNIIKQYAEQNSCCRFSINGHGYIYAYCNRHGLFRVKI